MKHTSHLDIGCNSNPRNPFNASKLYGVDIIDLETSHFNYHKCNLVYDVLPFSDSSFESVSAYDFLQIVPRNAIINGVGVFPFIHVMNEIYRVLKPGGIFYAITPGYPRNEAFVDPTSVNFITKKTHTYFLSPKYKARMYGFNGKFKIVRKVKWIKLTQETRNDRWLIKVLKNIFYTIYFIKKSHLIWEFQSLKDESSHD
jgi:SAM-dependent methyltransferase